MSLAVYFEEGFSTLFFISLIIAVMVIRDSCGIRYAVGQNTKRLNELSNILINEINGHTTVQVIAGIILGLVVSLIAYA
jgi:acid phosphatase family membrane protein YuiD